MSAVDHLRNVIFDTRTKPQDPRYFFYGPVGWIKIDHNKWFVQGDDEEYRDPTPEERATMKEFWDKLRG